MLVHLCWYICIYLIYSHIYLHICWCSQVVLIGIGTTPGASQLTEMDSSMPRLLSLACWEGTRAIPFGTQGDLHFLRLNSAPLHTRHVVLNITPWGSLNMQEQREWTRWMYAESLSCRRRIEVTWCCRFYSSLHMQDVSPYSLNYISQAFYAFCPLQIAQFWSQV